MNLSKTILIFLLMGSMISCERGNHFIQEKSIRNKVTKQFEERKKVAKNRTSQLFEIPGSTKLSRTEKEALQFLYAYMSLNDLADYDGTFFLKNIRSSLAARDTFSWGKRIPDEIFRHFVLPVRVNNENLDTSRWVFFSALKDRVMTLSMADAVLEVNHWCHEKVTYRSSDERTSSPLASVKSAIGRCGEESTLTVAALRSVGIPARQCYTPRWAHCDDNHAWVEAWVDGKWHYIGACEPEPVLDMAWFSRPAKRAMLVNTNVFGDYHGPEEVLVRDPLFTRINVLPGYTKTNRIVVKVTDRKNIPLDSAAVEFQLYNYAEFYPLNRCYTDQRGLCSFLTGFGDLMIWVNKNNQYGFMKASAGRTDTLLIQLLPGNPADATMDFDLTPPPDVNTRNQIDETAKNINSEKLATEDRLRTNYEKTFIDSAKAWRLAGNLHFNPDTLWDILRKSRGNWREIIDFITSVPDEKKNLVIPLLSVVTEKDLRDISPEVLMDHLNNSFVYPPLSVDQTVKTLYILSPRVESEYLRPYKSYFQKKFDKSFINKARNDPGLLMTWIRSNVRTDEKSNYSRAPITPIGVYELLVSDLRSMNILFVSLCRSFGIPARLEPGTRIPQYFIHGKWKDAVAEKQFTETPVRSSLTILSSNENERAPEYYINFTIQKMENGFFRSLDYEKEFPSWKFPQTLKLYPGSYCLMTGTRLPDGTVLSRLLFFTLKEGESKEVNIFLRKSKLESQIIAQIKEMNNFVPSISSSENTPYGNGLIIAWLEQEQEPSRHIISDLFSGKEKLENWKGSLLLLFKNREAMEKFRSSNKMKLPRNTWFEISSETSLQLLSKKIKKPVTENFPVLVFIKGDGKVLYFSEGYRIGSFNEIQQLLNK